MKSPKTISGDLYGMPGAGSTKTEAKADAARTLAAAMDGSYLPVILRFPVGPIGVVSRCTPYYHVHHWQYTILYPDAYDAHTHIGAYTRRPMKAQSGSERTRR